jgi:hypothetical protein
MIDPIRMLIFVSRSLLLTLPLRAAFAVGESTELALTDQVLRHHLREEFLSLSTEYFSHMAKQLSERTLNRKAENFQRWQTDTVRELVLPIRIENRSSLFVPQTVRVSVDGVEIGSMNLAMDKPYSEEFKWFRLRLREVPLGERLLQFSILGSMADRFVRIDSHQAIFIQGPASLNSLSMLIDPTIQNLHLGLSIRVLKEPE